MTCAVCTKETTRCIRDFSPQTCQKNSHSDNGPSPMNNVWGCEADYRYSEYGPVGVEANFISSQLFGELAVQAGWLIGYGNIRTSAGVTNFKFKTQSAWIGHCGRRRCMNGLSYNSIPRTQNGSSGKLTQRQPIPFMYPRQIVT